MIKIIISIIICSIVLGLLLFSLRQKKVCFGSNFNYFNFFSYIFGPIGIKIYKVFIFIFIIIIFIFLYFYGIFNFAIHFIVIFFINYIILLISLGVIILFIIIISFYRFDSLKYINLFNIKRFYNNNFRVGGKSYLPFKFYVIFLCLFSRFLNYYFPMLVNSDFFNYYSKGLVLDFLFWLGIKSNRFIFSSIGLNFISFSFNFIIFFLNLFICIISLLIIYIKFNIFNNLFIGCFILFLLYFFLFYILLVFLINNFNKSESCEFFHFHYIVHCLKFFKFIKEFYLFITSDLDIFVKYGMFLYFYHLIFIIIILFMILVNKFIFYIFIFFVFLLGYSIIFSFCINSLYRFSLFLKFILIFSIIFLLFFSYYLGNKFFILLLWFILFYICFVSIFIYNKIFKDLSLSSNNDKIFIKVLFSNLLFFILIIFFILEFFYVIFSCFYYFLFFNKLLDFHYLVKVLVKDYFFYMDFIIYSVLNGWVYSLDVYYITGDIIFINSKCMVFGSNYFLISYFNSSSLCLFGGGGSSIDISINNLDSHLKSTDLRSTDCMMVWLGGKDDFYFSFSIIKNKLDHYFEFHSLDICIFLINLILYRGFILDIGKFFQLGFSFLFLCFFSILFSDSPKPCKNIKRIILDLFNKEVLFIYFRRNYSLYSYVARSFIYYDFSFKVVVIWRNDLDMFCVKYVLNLSLDCSGSVNDGFNRVHIWDRAEIKGEFLISFFNRFSFYNIGYIILEEVEINEDRENSYRRKVRSGLYINFIWIFCVSKKLRILCDIYSCYILYRYMSKVGLAGEGEGTSSKFSYLGFIDFYKNGVKADRLLLKENYIEFSVHHRLLIIRNERGLFDSRRYLDFDFMRFYSYDLSLINNNNNNNNLFFSFFNMWSFSNSYLLDNRNNCLESLFSSFSYIFDILILQDGDVGMANQPKVHHGAEWSGKSGICFCDYNSIQSLGDDLYFSNNNDIIFLRKDRDDERLLISVNEGMPFCMDEFRKYVLEQPKLFRVGSKFYPMVSNSDMFNNIKVNFSVSYIYIFDESYCSFFGILDDKNYNVMGNFCFKDVNDDFSIDNVYLFNKFVFEDAYYRMNVFNCLERLRLDEAGCYDELLNSHKGKFIFGRCQFGEGQPVLKVYSGFYRVYVCWGIGVTCLNPNCVYKNKKYLWFFNDSREEIFLVINPLYVECFSLPCNYGTVNEEDLLCNFFYNVDYDTYKFRVFKEDISNIYLFFLIYRIFGEFENSAVDIPLKLSGRVFEDDRRSFVSSISNLYLDFYYYLYFRAFVKMCELNLPSYYHYHFYSTYLERYIRIKGNRMIKSLVKSKGGRTNAMDALHIKKVVVWDKLRLEIWKEKLRIFFDFNTQTHSAFFSSEKGYTGPDPIEPEDEDFTMLERLVPTEEHEFQINVFNQYSYEAHEAMVGKIMKLYEAEILENSEGGVRRILFKSCLRKSVDCSKGRKRARPILGRGRRRKIRKNL